MLPGRPVIAELDELQRKAHAARRALKAAESETRAALQLVAQVDDELTAFRGRHEPAQPERAQPTPAQPEEAQHAREDRQTAHA
jgi:hypothetical protein